MDELRRVASPKSPAVVALLAALAFLVGCGGGDATGPDPGSTEQPEQGTIQLDVTTVGSDADLDGYVFTLEGANGRGWGTVRIRPNGGESRSFRVTPGRYSWRVRDVAGNCRPDDPDGMEAGLEVSSGEVVRSEIKMVCGEIPPLRNRIVVATQRWIPTEDEIGLFTMAPDGSDRRPLALEAGAEGPFRDPGVSWDGKRVVYVEDYRELKMVNADGTGEPGTLFVSDNLQQPRWSPDGTVIAFSAARRLHLIAPDSTGSRSLSANPQLGGVNVDWAPDGTRIAFHGWTSTNDRGLHLIAPDGSGLRRITNSGDDDPRWAPDGTRIAFSSIRNGWPAGVFIMTPDGSEAAQITAGADSCDGCGDWVQGWSPDGRQVLFLRVYATNPALGPDPELFVYDLDRSEVIQLTDNDVAETSAFWVN